MSIILFFFWYYFRCIFDLFGYPFGFDRRQWQNYNINLLAIAPRRFLLYLPSKKEDYNFIPFRDVVQSSTLTHWWPRRHCHQHHHDRHPLWNKTSLCFYCCVPFSFIHLHLVLFFFPGAFSRSLASLLLSFH